MSNESSSEIAGDFVLLIQDYFRKFGPALNLQIEAEIFELPEYGEMDVCDETALEFTGAYPGSVPFNSILINGRGQHYRRGNDTPEVNVPKETVKVEANNVYRLRIINIGATYPLQFSIDEHKLHAIAEDGRNIIPVTADSLIVGNGERVDVFIKTSPTKNVYTIRCETLERIERGTFRNVLPHYSLASLIVGEPTDMAQPSTRKDCKKTSPCIVFNCENGSYLSGTRICISLNDIQNTPKVRTIHPPPGIDDDILEIFLNFHNIGGENINQKRFIWPTSPLLITSYDIDDVITPCESIGDEFCTHMIKVPFNSTVQFVLTNTVNLPPGRLIKLSTPDHPVHVHGYHFSVLKVGRGKSLGTGTRINYSPDIKPKLQNGTFVGTQWTNESWKGGNIPNLDLTKSVLKDTVVVPGGGYVVTRIKANNPGFWMLHCHMTRHQRNGMVLVLQVGERDEMVPPPSAMPKDCGTFDWDGSYDHLNAVNGTEKADLDSSGGILILLITLLGVTSTMLVVLAVSLAIYGMRRGRKRGYKKVNQMIIENASQTETRKLLTK